MNEFSRMNQACQYSSLRLDSSATILHKLGAVFRNEYGVIADVDEFYLPT